jgi:hypothetical protein
MKRFLFLGRVQIQPGHRRKRHLWRRVDNRSGHCRSRGTRVTVAFSSRRLTALAVGLCFVTLNSPYSRRRQLVQRFLTMVPGSTPNRFKVSRLERSPMQFTCHTMARHDRPGDSARHARLRPRSTRDAGSRRLVPFQIPGSCHPHGLQLETTCRPFRNNIATSSRTIKQPRRFLPNDSRWGKRTCHHSPTSGATSLRLGPPHFLPCVLLFGRLRRAVTAHACAGRCTLILCHVA